MHYLGLQLLLLALKEVLVDCILLLADLVPEEVIAEHEEGEGIRVSQDASCLKELLQPLSQITAKDFSLYVLALLRQSLQNLVHR